MSDYEITCPHDDCDDALFVQWHAVYTLSPDDIAESAAAAGITDAHAETWSVECAAGHVLLLPGLIGCPCDDPEGPDCPHDPDAYDWSEDRRIFRVHDYERLRQVLEAIGGAP